MDEMMQIQGDWINKNTGQKIHIKNSVIDGDQMIIITNLGQLSMDEFSRNYIQVSDDIYDMNGKIITTNEYEQQINKNLPKVETLDTQEYIINDKPVDFNNIEHIAITTDEAKATAFTINKSSNTTSITNIELIKKVFDKVNAKPEINVTINFNEFPKEQIATLVNFLDVSIDDIANYLYTEYVNENTVKEQIKSIINRELTKTCS